jgi:predicted RNA-binding protein with EMAP domain
MNILKLALSSILALPKIFSFKISATARQQYIKLKAIDDQNVEASLIKKLQNIAEEVKNITLNPYELSQSTDLQNVVEKLHNITSPIRDVKRDYEKLIKEDLENITSLKYYNYNPIGNYAES